MQESEHKRRSTVKRPTVKRPTMKRPTMKRQAGFTLMEALVITAIIGIIAGIAFFSYRNLRPRLELNNTAREVMALIHRARLAAIRNHNIVTISLEKELGDPASPYNPEGVRAERLIVTRTNAFGDSEEITSYQLPKSYPPIYVWGDEESAIHGDSSITFTGDELTINSDGTVSDLGAFRLSYPKDGQRNILEVAVQSRSGSPLIRKYLAPGDRPSSPMSTQEYFVETVATSDRDNVWVWY